ncbi:MAG: YoaK family protein [Microlunatus sp.]
MTVSSPSAPIRASHPLVLMLVLTFSTGMIDAVGYLGLDRVFTANMTGNVVILGMALTGTASLPVVGPLIALLTFMAGAGFAGRLLRSARGTWSGLTTTSFALTGGTVLVVGVTCLIWHPVPGTPWGDVVTGTLGLAMGVQAACARKLGVKDVTTVVITSTITGLAADSRFAGGSSENWARRLLAVLLMLLGAAAGALLLHIDIALGLLVAGAIVLGTTAIGHTKRHG